MFRLFKIYFILFSNLGVLFALNYDTLVLLEFENVSRSKSSDYLRHHLPDIIKDYNLDRNVNIEYAGEIEPYLGMDNQIYQSALIVLGCFSLENSRIDVSIDTYDMNSWKKVNTFSFFCGYQDDICFEKNMGDYSLNILDKASIDFHSVDNFNDNHLDDIPIQDNFYESLGSFAIEADFNNTWHKLYEDGNQYGKRYYKDIDQGFYKHIVENSREKNTEKLISFIDSILLNPYDVSIGDISMDSNSHNRDYVVLKIPITYHIKKSFIEDMLTTLPHFSRSDANGELIIKFMKSDFIFSNSIVDRFALMKHQVLPVIFLSNDLSKVQYIYIDSWKKNYNIDDLGHNIMVDKSNEFFPLFAITPGEDNMQVNLDMTTLDVTYQFSVPLSDASEYSKVAIKFLYEDELKSLLDRFYKLN
tara:strand:+ start:1524 stop:2771 length:1248 start_codon:yes stop_codon:yes gene_type:complete